MKFLLPALTLLSTATAFTVTRNPTPSSFSTQLFAEETTTDTKINTLIDLDSPKVVNMEALEEGEKKVYCRCWKSGTFPLCDAAHVEHNKACGDNVGPLIVSAPKKEE